MNYGSHTVGAGTSGWVTLTNLLTTPLAITEISTSGDFSQTNNCNGSVRAGWACKIQVTFTPKQLGTRTGTLTISDSAGSQSVSLSGTGSLVGLASIQVMPTLPKVASGLQQQFTATGRFTGGTSSIITGAVTWGSTNTAVATISNAEGSRGLATAVALGTTSISAAVGSIKGGVTLTVTAPVLSYVFMSPANPATPLGLPTQFSLTGHYTDSSSAPITSGVTWTSTAASVATIDQHGLATSKGVGSSTITATVGNMGAQTTLTILPPALVSLTLSPPNPSIGQGSSQQFTATGTYTDRSQQVVGSGITWSSSNQSMPIDQQGVVRGSGTGTTTITASVNAVSGSTTLTVSPVLVGISVAPNHIIVPAGLPQQFTASGTYSDHSTQVLTNGVTWSSSAPANVSINSQGLATALIPHTSALITAAVGAVHGSTDIFVDVPQVVAVSVTPQDPQLVTGATQQLQAIGLYSDHTSQAISYPSMYWTSSDASLASVYPYGVVTAIGTGAPIVTAHVPYVANGQGHCCLTGSTTVHVVPAAAQSLAISPAHPAIAPGTAVRLTALRINNDGSKTPVANPVNWSSSAPAVAAIASDGTLTTLSPGVATVSVQCPDLGLAGSMPVEVYDTNQARFAYVLNSYDNSITMYLVDGTSGQLSAAEITPVGDGTKSPISLTADPTGRFLYLADRGAGSVWGYAVDAGNGSLSLIQNSVSANSPWSLGMHPSGKYLFAVGNSVEVYSIDTTGALTAATALPDRFAITLAFDPTGAFAYGANINNNSISGFQFDALTGALNPMPATFAAGPSPAFVAVHPSGRFAYVANENGQSLSEFTIDSVSGAMSAIGQPVPTGQAPVFLTFDTTAKYLYVANNGSATISGFSVDPATGGLTAMPLSPFATDQWPNAMAIDPSNHFLYVANAVSNDVTIYSVGLDGGLTRVSTAPTPSPISLVLLKGTSPTRPQVIMSLVLDRSGSMSADGGAAALPPAVTNFVNKFDDIIDQLAMVSFASNSTVDVSMRAGWKTAITTAINTLAFGGATFAAGGLSDGFAQINSAAATHQNAAKVAVFFTDGHPNTIQGSLACISGARTLNFGGYDSPNNVSFFDPTSGSTYCTATNGLPPPCCGATTYYSPSAGQQLSFLQPNVAADARYEAAQVANQMRAEGITVYAIGLGNSVDQAFLQQVANDPNSLAFDPTKPVGQAVIASQESDLDAAFQAIASKILGQTH